ncbi:putative aminohydrolase SsnA [bacterium]|nr:putative aminohydrolase SsnA [candidate division CSSED10-310 bacterium]
MLITNGVVVTFGKDHRIIPNGAVKISGDKIECIGESAVLESKYPDDSSVDAEGQLIMPGNICAHTHFYGAFARGLAIPGAAPKNFPEILGKLWWKLDRSLHAKDVEFSTLACLVDAIKHGTTTLIDHHASPGSTIGSLDIIADAVKKSGLRACLSYEVSDRNGAEETEFGINENERFLKKMTTEPDSMLAGSFGLHASLSLANKTLEKCRAVAETLNTGFHLHAAEGLADQEDSTARFGKRVIHRLHDAGILGSKTILAHCVHIDAWEMERIRDTGTWVTHQPRSNMNNAVGVSPVETMLRGGIKVAMGNDGFSNNMFAEWKAAYLLHKIWQGDPRAASGNDVITMAVTNNAALTRIFWPEAPLGELSAGAYADIIMVDYQPITEMTAGNLPWHILFGFEASAVTGTMAAGKWLMKDRILTTLNEREIAAHSRECANAVWQRFAE